MKIEITKSMFHDFCDYHNDRCFASYYITINDKEINLCEKAFKELKEKIMEEFK